ncbi:hypothetical protein RCL1_000222 [Eukaryota sp. TZLM3-RCL]
MSISSSRVALLPVDAFGNPLSVTSILSAPQGRFFLTDSTSVYCLISGDYELQYLPLFEHLTGEKFHIQSLTYIHALNLILMYCSDLQFRFFSFPQVSFVCQIPFRVRPILSLCIIPGTSNMISAHPDGIRLSSFHYTSLSTVSSVLTCSTLHKQNLPYDGDCNNPEWPVRTHISDSSLLCLASRLSITLHSSSDLSFVKQIRSDTASFVSTVQIFKYSSKRINYYWVYEWKSRLESKIIGVFPIILESTATIVIIDQWGFVQLLDLSNYTTIFSSPQLFHPDKCLLVSVTLSYSNDFLWVVCTEYVYKLHLKVECQLVGTENIGIVASERFSLIKDSSLQGHIGLELDEGVFRDVVIDFSKDLVPKFSFSSLLFPVSSFGAHVQTLTHPLGVVISLYRQTKGSLIVVYDRNRRHVQTISHDTQHAITMIKCLYSPINFDGNDSYLSLFEDSTSCSVVINYPLLLCGIDGKMYLYKLKLEDNLTEFSFMFKNFEAHSHEILMVSIVNPSLVDKFL